MTGISSIMRLGILRIEVGIGKSCVQVEVLIPAVLKEMIVPVIYLEPDQEFALFVSWSLSSQRR